jgi:hypothetical protein
MRRVWKVIGGGVLLVLFLAGLVVQGVQKVFNLGDYAHSRAITQGEFRSVGRTSELDTLEGVRDRLGKPLSDVSVKPPSAKQQCIHYYERGAASVPVEPDILGRSQGSGKPGYQFCFVDGKFKSKRALVLKKVTVPGPATP